MSVVLDIYPRESCAVRMKARRVMLRMVQTLRLMISYHALSMTYPHINCRVRTVFRTETRRKSACAMEQFWTTVHQKYRLWFRVPTLAQKVRGAEPNNATP